MRLTHTHTLTGRVSVHKGDKQKGPIMKIKVHPLWALNEPATYIHTEGVGGTATAPSVLKRMEQWSKSNCTLSLCIIENLLLQVYTHLYKPRSSSFLVVAWAILNARPDSRKAWKRRHLSHTDCISIMFYDTWSKQQPFLASSCTSLHQCLSSN